MINVTKISSAGAAFDYYTERDDYYLSDKSSAEWHGRGAAALGLAGDIDPQNFHAVLTGRFGATAVGTPDRHTPGWDVTFSAPKSVTVAALVNKDERVTAAHDRAVRAALDHIERNAIVTRQRGADGDYDYRNTSSMVAGVVRHSTNRNADPQLHSHAVVANMTLDPETGRWGSIDSRQGLYQDQVEANNVYMGELAAGLREAGYTVDWDVRDNGAVSFELREIPESIRETFSSRRQEIDAELSARGTTRAAADRREREAATLDTRSPKEHVPGRVLHERWEGAAIAAGYQPGARPAPADERPWGDREAAAADAVKAGIAHLSERETRLTERALMGAAAIAAQGRAREEDLAAAIRAARERGELLDRQTLQERPGQKMEMVAGYTTPDAVRTEQRMLQSAERIARAGHGHARIGEAMRGDNTTSKVDAAIARQETQTGHKFTGEQRAAVNGILRGDSGLHIVQGHAGTAKTSTVLATVAAEAKASGWDVRAMAPTNSAAKTLGDAIGAAGQTVASKIHQLPDRVPSAAPGIVWIVDEAGMASAKDKEALLSVAVREHARVVLVGDDKQIGSVGAGAAFGQIKEAHRAETYELTEIKRQTSAQLREAVYDSIKGDAKSALDKVEVVEHKVRDAGVQAVADRYMRHADAGKETLVVTLSRDDRRDVNKAIQQRREARGEVRDARDVVTLRDKQWTPAQKADASRYQPGDVIEAGRDFRGGPRRGEVATVKQVRDGKVTVERANGQRWRFDPKKVNRYAALDRETARMGAGDKIVAKGAIAATGRHGEKIEIKNGAEMTVSKVRVDGRIDVEMGKGRAAKNATIDASQGVRADLGYAQTANQAQGRTVDVAIGSMRSTQHKLADQQRIYVMMSRAREKAVIHTDDKEKLAEQIARHSGGKETALQAAAAPRQAPQISQQAQERAPAPQRQRGPEASRDAQPQERQPAESQQRAADAVAAQRECGQGAQRAQDRDGRQPQQRRHDGRAEPAAEQGAKQSRTQRAQAQPERAAQSQQQGQRVAPERRHPAATQDRAAAQPQQSREQEGTADRAPERGVVPQPQGGKERQAAEHHRQPKGPQAGNPRPPQERAPAPQRPAPAGGAQPPQQPGRDRGMDAA